MKYALRDWKTCTRCDAVKPVEDFYLNKNGARHSWCKECAREAARARHRRKKGHPESGRIATPRPCACCGYSFTPQHDHRHVKNVYCGKGCQRGRPANASTLHWHRCFECDEVLEVSGRRPGGRRFCESCAMFAVRCHGCGVSVELTGEHAAGKQFCDDCKVYAAADRNRRKSSKRRGAGSGDYSKMEIGERDGWRCHLCGDRVDRRLSGNDSDGPTIDHLIPVSVGGRDVRENVALAHRRCNTARGARGEVQLRLLG